MGRFLWTPPLWGPEVTSKQSADQRTMLRPGTPGNLAGGRLKRTGQGLPKGVARPPKLVKEKGAGQRQGRSFSRRYDRQVATRQPHFIRARADFPGEEN